MNRAGCNRRLPAAHVCHPESGASLMETLVAFGLTVSVSAVALQLFSFHQRLAGAQLEASSLQQGQRAVHRELRRTLRAAGRGGLVHQLPGQAPRPELAVDVETDVSVGHPVGLVTAAEGTDVLVVRGVINGPLYWVEDYGFDPAAGSGWVQVRAQTPGGDRQSLDMLEDAGDAGDDALLLISGEVAAVHGVAPIVEVTADGRGPSRRLRVEFHTDASRGPPAADYLAMSSGGAWPAGHMGRVDRVGVLEEWRFYIRPPETGSRRGAQLAMARLYPGAGIAWRRRSSNLAQIVAEDIVDLGVTVEESAQGPGWTVTVVSTARAGAPAAAALRLERTATSVVHLRNLW